MKELIEKQGNYIAYLQGVIRALRQMSGIQETGFNTESVQKYESDIAALEAGLKEQPLSPYEGRTVYNEKYLKECIKKATPRLSKIKDVDEYLRELRGGEPELTDEEIEKEFPINIDNIRKKRSSEGYNIIDHDNNGDKLLGILRGINIAKQEGAKWYRDKK